MTVRIITLGCTKNLVDSEHLLAQFRAAGHELLLDSELRKADVLIINTCGFILDAKEESIETILEYVEEKRQGRIGRLYVMGCLSERYREELSAELPEVDGFFGVWDWPSILKAAGNQLDESLMTDRIVTTPSHYAYLKISEGCNRTCAFCAIPGIRGKQRSLSVETLVEESRRLVNNGVKELILVAQDLTSYGTDLYQRRALAKLLKELERIPGLEWIRLHYAYPKGFPEDLIDQMASSTKICHYLDIPIQHINDHMLKVMGRGHSRATLENLLFRFRSAVPDIALRTTLVTGFPGETEAAFQELVDFISGFRFERLGVFPYSHEEQTPAHEKFQDDVPQKVKIKRVEALMERQQEISLQLNRQRVGDRYKVLVDRLEGEYYIGRTQYDSPEVDNEVLLSADAGLNIGEFYQVRITDAEAFDLYGEVVPSAT
ncbi:MAG: 30S ribosomal protein S12 methylthiotransferase RimO [Bacteroidales bacterium]